MPHPKGWVLPTPEFHQEFEAMSRDLLTAKKRPLVEPNLYGRNGQPQQGMDFTLELADGVHGYQCKRVEGFTFAEFEAEVAKATEFPIALRSYTVLLTLPLDTHLQAKVMALSQTRREQGKHPVAVVFWPTIQDWFGEHLDVLRAHYKEITPSMLDLLQGSARRIDEELPGTTLSVHSRPGHVDYVVNPGPDGVPFTTTFVGRDVFERFATAMKRGEEVTFEDQEFEFHLPPALQAAMGYGPGKGKLTMTPVLNGHTIAGSIVVHPRSRHHSGEIFKRRAAVATDAITGRLSVVRHGSEHEEVLIQADRIPLRLVIERSRVGPTWSIKIRSDRPYAGQLVEAALAAERVLQTMDLGAYFGVFADGIQVVFENEPRTPLADEPQLLRPLEMLNELSELSGWEIRLDNGLDLATLTEAESLLELFKEGRRRVDVRGRLRQNLQTPDHLGAAQALVSSANALSMRITQEATEIEFMGENRPIPAYEIQFTEVVVSDEVRARVLAAVEPPVMMELEVASGSVVFQSLTAGATS